LTAPRVSIVVPVRNEEKRLGACLEALSGQSFEKFEVIVVDDASTDATPDVLARHRDPRTVRLRNAVRRGIAASRNAALARARGTFVFFTDADCVPDRDWIAAGLDRFAPRTAGLSGLTHYVAPGFRPSIRDRIRATAPLRPNPLVNRGHRHVQSTFMCCNAAYRKEALDRVGGFNEAYGNVMEDFDLYLRVRASLAGRPGAELAECPAMIVRHQRTLYTVRSLLADTDQGNIVRLKRDHGYENPLVFWGPVVLPTFLALAVFPPLWLPYFWLHGQKPSAPGDVLYLPLFAVRGILLRLSIWRAALRLGVLAL
jgi:glycosyltransferase involved in cell wall biosynthesis